MTNLRIKKEKGFTLIETLVAISILMLGILGPLSIASSGLKNARYGRDQVTASYLAQEGIEYVRYIRDNNRIERLNGASVNWLAGLGKCFVDTNPPSGYGCWIDVPQEFGGTNIIDNCSSSGCPKLRIDDNGYYTYTAGEPLSLFTRTIRIKPTSVGGVSDEARAVRVESTVIWAAGSDTRTFTAVENVFNQ